MNRQRFAYLALLMAAVGLFVVSAGVAFAQSKPPKTMGPGPEVLSDQFYRRQLRDYLRDHPRIRGQMGIEVDHPTGQSSQWLYYDYWPEEWKNRLGDFYVAFGRNVSLPMESTFPLAGRNVITDTSCFGYRSVELARDVYFAHVAYAIWLDAMGRVPWRLEGWSDHEMSYLLSSKVLFCAYRVFPSNDLYYVVYVGSRSEATENILRDPRVATRFMLNEPEEGKRLLGRTAEETGRNVSCWFHDYLWHRPGGFDQHQFHWENPMLEDRLKRHYIPGVGNVYEVSGCGSASALFADLMRGVNIPVRKVNNALVNVSGEEQSHSGLVFDWQGGGGTSRYLLHTDDLFTTSQFEDPAPAPRGTGRGVALWDHVWLSPTRFGQLFAYDPRPEYFGKATWQQQVKYHNLGEVMMCTAMALTGFRNTQPAAIVEFLMNERRFARAEAEAASQAIEATVLSYGEGDRAVGFQRLLDGPDSRHGRWCSRTGKCEY